jgi:alanyl-tRNA synthetase
MAVAQLFSADRDTTPELVARAIQESKSLKKRIRELLEITAEVEAAEMLSKATPVGGFKLVQATFEGRDVEEVRLLASKITQAEPSVALLGTRDAGAARVVFARSASLDQNMGQLLAEACQLLGGRGGGRPDLAQGGGPEAAKLEVAIRLAAEKVLGH